MAKKKIEDKTNEIRYDKQSILKSKKYSERKDILSVILEDNVEYTLFEIENKLKEFMEGVIN